MVPLNNTFITVYIWRIFLQRPDNTETGLLGPIMSTATFSKGMLTTGTLCNGARDTVPLYTVLWQMSQEAHKCFTL